MPATTVNFATTPPARAHGQQAPGRAPRRRPVPRGALRLAAGALAVSLLYLALPGAGSGLSADGRITLTVFAAAVLAWMFSGWDDTYVGLGAALLLVLLGVLHTGEFLGSLGGELVWLLIAAFVLAHGLTRSGLPARFAILLCARARTVRGLAHLLTAVLVATALAVPSTSGRAALALPVFLALATALAHRTAVVRAFALLFPTVVLLSAAATLIGAGAHVITSQLLVAATGSGIGFGHWLLLGLPFAALSSHLATELVLLLMTSRAERTLPLRLDPDRMAADAGITVRGRLTGPQSRALLVLLGTVAMWCAEPWHGLSPALVALIGALLCCTPGLGNTEIGPALSAVPWSLLLFMVSTAVLGVALSTSGAAGWLGAALLGGNGSGMAMPLLLFAAVSLSVAAHLVLQSRSARSSVLVPLLIPLAIGSGMNPAALAFASTVAAGFCHTTASSAKPVAMFARLDGVPTYRDRDLLALSAALAPLMVALVLAFAVTVWPALGLPLH